MKKLFVCLCAGVLLAGCGGGSTPKEKVTKTCTISATGMTSNFIIEGEGDTVSKGTLEVIASYEAMGVTYEDVKDADESALKSVQEAVLKQMDMSEDDGKVTTEVTPDGLKISIAIEIGELEKTFAGTTMDEMIETATTSGYTCK